MYPPRESVHVRQLATRVSGMPEVIAALIAFVAAHGVAVSWTAEHGLASVFVRRSDRAPTLTSREGARRESRALSLCQRRQYE